MNRDRHAQVKRLFLEACQLEGDRRRSLLDRECGADSVLRDEVESLFRHHDTRTILADTPAYLPIGAAGSSEATVSRFAPLATRDSTVPRGLSDRRRLAWIALVATLLLALLGYWVYNGIGTSLRRMRADKLESLLDAQIMTLQYWMRQERQKVESWARSPSLQQSVEALRAIDTNTPGAADTLRDAPQRLDIQGVLEAMADHDVTYAVWDPGGVMVATDLPELHLLGERISEAGGTGLIRVLEGETVLWRPYEKTALVRRLRRRNERPVIVILTPVRDDTGSVIGVLGIADLGADDRFSKILSAGRTGRTGETYAFDRFGTMLTESRFNDQLKDLGLIRDTPEARSSVAVQLHDPGGDMTAGYRHPAPLATRPLTRMARHATAGRDGVDLDGYRDYRGVNVVGAWRWIEDESFGVATKVDYDEAYAPLRYLRIAFALIFGPLVASVGAVILFSSRIHRLQRQVGQARKLGQYTLEEKIGEGGMGVVYRARHAMLRRPTAVKLLKPELVNDQTVARFEREVQLASQLTHPNTIEIYDYGRTPEGIFYYAMEYLPGISLDQLVALDGRVGAPRVIHILRQVCLSLSEAHGVGLVHRDIKPHNIMLCRRGGDDDVVKVLDFGLVKPIDSGGDAGMSASRELSGTPLYIAPERLTDPGSLDVRADLYSVGAVAFKLLTGEDVFRATGPVDALYQAMQSDPRRPSDCAGCDVPARLDQLVIDCLAKAPDHRPQTAMAIVGILNALVTEHPWTQADARAWWSQQASRLTAGQTRTLP